MNQGIWNSKQEISQLLEENGLTLKKRFGQNFLLDAHHRERIVSALDPAEGERVWEIGPGIGSITHKLLEKTPYITVFEIDHGLIRVLGQLFNDRLKIVEGDFLKTFEAELAQQGLPDKLIGNLPYSTGSVMIGSLAEKDALPGVSVFTLQKEVARRMAAAPGSPDYSGFSLVCQLRCRVEKICDIGGGAFYPPPRVVSSVIRLVRRDDAPAGPYPEFFRLVQDLFRSRRKTAANNLKSGLTVQQTGWDTIRGAAERTDLDLSRRGETFSREEVLDLLAQMNI